MDKEKIDEIRGLTSLGEIVKFPSGYAELLKNYGIRN